jgi:hypothetical protein
MTYYTHRSKIPAPHYVCIDVSSDDPSDQTMYYTHYSSKAGAHHVQVEVHSEHSAKQEEIT